MSRHDRISEPRSVGYYGQPPLKSPHWDWKVSGYIALVGISGAAQALAWIGRLTDGERFAGAQRNARILALAGAAAGSGLLIKDLRTPRRFYNMLRIFRRTSPMSIGTYILAAFGGTSAVAALGEVPGLRRAPMVRRVADIAQAGAAVSGAGAATYTAGLLSATSNPWWAAAPRALGAEFATSSVAGAAAILALGERAAGRRRTARRFEAIAALATAAHLCASQAAAPRRRVAGVEQEMAGVPERRRLKAAELVAGAAPLAAYAVSRVSGRGAPAAVAGSLAVLAGGWLVRDAVLRTGKESARNPGAAFRLASQRALTGQSRSLSGQRR